MFVPLIRVSAAQNRCSPSPPTGPAWRSFDGGSSTSYYGRSCIAGPRGELLAEAGPDPDTVISAELDPLALDEARQRLWVYRDRRPELYGPIVRAPGTSRS